MVYCLWADQISGNAYSYWTGLPPNGCCQSVSELQYAINVRLVAKCTLKDCQLFFSAEMKRKTYMYTVFQIWAMHRLKCIHHTNAAIHKCVEWGHAKLDNCSGYCE